MHLCCKKKGVMYWILGDNRQSQVMPRHVPRALTRVGAEPVSEEEELNRVLPVLALLKEKGFSVPISVDTFYAKVAKSAIESGASIINDVTGGNFDSQMFSVVSEAKVPIIITHSRFFLILSFFSIFCRGNAKTMSSLADYKNVTEEVKGALLTSAFAAQTVGKTGDFQRNF